MLTTSNAQKHVDFAKVEVLRRHMLLSVSDMAKVLGVSRVTYYSWVRGKQPRMSNLARVKARIRRMLALLTEQNWPSTEVLEMAQADRVQRLIELLGQEQ
jgi:DNA-binding XRE family transcriptional regulator